MAAERGELYLGGGVEPATGDRTGEDVRMPGHHLTTHGVIVGMTGSGKTGLGVVLLEEALLSGVSVLVLDPKGDMGNLLLTFPDLRPDDFLPWVDPAEARRKGVEVDALAAATASEWRDALASWGIEPDRIRRLKEAAAFTLYTPGSSAGVPLNLLGSLRAPARGSDGAVQPDDMEATREEIEGFVSSLLTLAGLEADPLSSREHILLSTLIEHEWAAGRDLELADLIRLVQAPPFRKLGVFALDEFFPEKDRRGLAMRMNALMASPSFASWLEGMPLDLDTLMRGPDGRPGASIVYLAHLSDAERQFVVTLLLTRLITWMRQQPGTSDLRLLVYMDEMFGFAPPTAAPPSKKPILTLFKQARAHGVGMVVSTQNPVDLDYKVISNAGTWMLGRLQTERDKARVLEGLRSASGAVDVGAMDALLSGLRKREFVLHTTRAAAPTVFTTRWAMSYLRGSLTREEVGRLAGDASGGAVGGSAGASAGPLGGTAAGGGAHSEGGGAVPTGARAAGAAEPAVLDGGTAAAAAAEGGGAGATAAGGSTGLAAGARGSAPAAAAEGGGAGAPASVRDESPVPAGGAPIADDETPVAPAVPASVPVYHLDPAAAWAAEVGAVPGSTRLEPALVARLRLTFDDQAAQVSHSEEWEAVFFPLDARFDPAGARTVDYDERDFRDQAPPNARYVLGEAPITSAAFFRDAGRALGDEAWRQRKVTVFRNADLGLYSRPGEAQDAFLERCRGAAAEKADEGAAKLRDRYAAKIDRLRDALARVESRVREVEVDVSARKQHEIVAGAGKLLSMFLRGRASAAGLSGVASRRSMTRRAEERLRTATERQDEQEAEIRDLEDELANELRAIVDDWEGRAEAVEAVEIGLEKNDVAVDEVALLWIPR